ncbi:HAAS signaling domain-containing protein [Sporosarcina pasteurii]|uniref:Uncharacterized protein n=1 Tax=Sporosarcina pasteurii TaxID=1474 RepID=A0A380CH28_SPOPA|nr:hypothetical protein [Sporosarcina pasteurii]MDS9473184.1 hypothetical protein [Sporosarcina pasteurii]QBQ06919.1 hypothetical protein E2C16_15340 [Sporosarcina pasteurii]SUJ19478.1 Uncharacterised protein [Sporosarcina pasteurii]
MNLIEAYAYEVTRRLPEKSRDDIALELHTIIEDMLPDDYTEKEVMEALSKLGDPAQLAASYRDTPKFLIGPKVYDAYMRTMKIIVPWVIFITILVYVVESIVLFSGEQSILSVMIKGLGMIIANIIQALIHTFFWVTLVFIAIERFGLAGNIDSKLGTIWTPEDLKQVNLIPKKKIISKGEVVFGFIWTAIWVGFYFNADRLAGIYRSTDGHDLQMIMPIFDQTVLLSYWPIILPFALLEIGLGIYKWKTKQWTMKLVTINAVIKVFSVVAFIVIASNPNLINEAVAPYMVTLLEISLSSVNNFMNWAVWTIVITIIVTVVIEVYETYRKAKVI